MGLTSGPCSLLPASHTVLAHTTSASNTSFSPAFPPPRLPLPPMFSTPRAEWPFPNTDTVGPLLEQPTLQRLPIALRLDTSASWLQVTLLTLCASAVAASPAISLLCLSYTVFQRLEQKKVPCHLLGFQTVLSEASLTNTPSASNSTLRPQLLSSPPLGNLRQPPPLLSQHLRHRAQLPVFLPLTFSTTSFLRARPCQSCSSLCGMSRH